MNGLHTHNIKTSLKEWFEQTRLAKHGVQWYALVKTTKFPVVFLRTLLHARC
jgi:hypothetical protein